MDDLKIFYIVCFVLFFQGSVLCQTLNPEQDVEVEIPTWFNTLDSLDVTQYSSNTILSLLDTINYRKISNEQKSVLNKKIDNLKQRFVAVHGVFPVIYPKTRVFVQNMYCGTCAKFVKRVLENEAVVKSVISVDTLEQLITISYDTSFIGKEEEKLFPFLASKLELYNYVLMSENESTDPAMSEAIDSSLIFDGVLYCPLHAIAPTQEEMLFNREEEDSIIQE